MLILKHNLKQVAALYDWSKELNTTDPALLQMDPMDLLQMFKAGLAYEAEMPINWCPNDLTGLANEEVVNGRCDRCGTSCQHKEFANGS